MRAPACEVSVPVAIPAPPPSQALGSACLRPRGRPGWPLAGPGAGHKNVMSLTLGCGACALAQPPSIIRPVATSHVLRSMLCITILLSTLAPSVARCERTTLAGLAMGTASRSFLRQSLSSSTGQRPLMAEHSLAVNPIPDVQIKSRAQARLWFRRLPGLTRRPWPASPWPASSWPASPWASCRSRGLPCRFSTRRLPRRPRRLAASFASFAFFAFFPACYPRSPRTRAPGDRSSSTSAIGALSPRRKPNLRILR